LSSVEATFQDFLAWFASREGGSALELRDWLVEWLEACERRGLRPATVQSYRTLLALHVDDRLGRTALAEITPVRLNQLYDRMLRTGRRNGKGGLSARTVRYFHTVLNKALGDAVRAGHLTRNPAALADPPSPRAARPPVYPVCTPEELTQYLRAVKDDPHYLAFHLAAATGLRRGELLGLRWCDVDCSSRQLRVVQALIEVGHELTISVPKTERSRRVAALDAKTTELLALEREIAECREAFDDRDLLFTTDGGDPIHPALFSYYFTRSIRRAGARRIRLHDLRHTHATHALQAGVHPKVVSERLGHSTVTITLDTYMHVLPSMQRDAAEAVAALIDV
jgi:integrase